MGYNFKAEALHEPPYAIANMDNLETGKDTQIGGIWGEIWHQTLEKTMNFSTLFLPCPDRQWGSVDEMGPGLGLSMV